LADALTAVVTIPGLALKTPGNRREHWRAVAARARVEKDLTRLALLALGRDVRDRLRAAPRLRVRFVKTGGRKCDSDNLVAALKHVRDALAESFARDDGDDWFEWVWPGQEPGGPAGVRIELTAGAA
jgi:hypothetical protein